MMKTQAMQVDEKKEEERQISGIWLNRPDHQRALEEECLRKEPFFCQSLLFTPSRTMLLPTAWHNGKEGRNNSTV